MVRENRCVTPFCEEFGIVFETRMGMDEPEPKCPECMAITERVPSRFAAPWTGTLDRFNQVGCETHDACEGGHIAYRVRSSRLADGSPEAVRITNRQQQREFCKAEGLEDPTDVNPNMRGAEDGKFGHFGGDPGQWSGTPASMIDDVNQKSTWRTVVDGVAYRSDIDAGATALMTNRYDDIKSGRVQPIDGEEAFARLRARSAERRAG